MGKKIIEVEHGNEDQFFKESEPEEDISEVSDEYDPLIKGKAFANADREPEIKQKIDEIRFDFKKRVKFISFQFQPKKKTNRWNKRKSLGTSICPLSVMIKSTSKPKKLTMISKEKFSSIISPWIM